MAELEQSPSGRVHVIAGGGAAVDRLLAGIGKRQRAQLHQMPLAAARSAYAAASKLLDIAAPPGEATHVHLMAPHGHTRLRVSQAGADLPPRRVLVWVHGGGFCLGNAELSDALCRWFSHRLNAAVVSVDYRLAPEHSVHDAVADVVEAVSWTQRRFPDIPVDMLGESAGASLAALAAADRTVAGLPGVGALVLCYPLVLSCGSTASRRRFAEGHYLTMADIQWMIEQAGLTPNGGPLAPLMQEQRLAGLPRTLMALPHRDPLFDEGAALARRLQSVGVPVSELHLPELVHGCLHMGGLLPVVNNIHEYIVGFLEDCQAPDQPRR